MKVMLDEGAYMPERAHGTDAGYDLRSPWNVTVPARGNVTIDTGVHMLIPEGYAGVLISKSGLNVRYNLTSTGLIDAGYTGAIKVKLYNQGDETAHIAKGNKISQIVIVPVAMMALEQVTEMPETPRGTGGFGSTGV